MDVCLNPEENRLYRTAGDLHRLHWEKLRCRNPEEAAAASGGFFEGGLFSLLFFGRTIVVDPLAGKVYYAEEPERECGYQSALAVVSYLTGAIDADVKGEFVSPREFPGAEAFFRGPHALPVERIAAKFGRDARGFCEKALTLGGELSEGGDGAAVIWALPKIPLKVILWEADGEMEGAVTLLTDRRAYLHLQLDVFWALCNVAAAKLTC